MIDGEEKTDVNILGHFTFKEIRSLLEGYLTMGLGEMAEDSCLGGNSGEENGWRKIYIMGMPTVEIDYSGLHIVFLYALENLDYWSLDGEDPYSLPGYDNNESTREL